MSAAPARKLQLIRAAWGCYHAAAGQMNMKTFLSKAKADGASGIEIPLVLALDHGKQDFIQLLREYEMDVVFQIFTDGPMAPGDGELWQSRFTERHPIPALNPETCARVFKAQVEEALDFNPIKINSHSMRDFFTFSEAQQFFDDVLPFQQDINQQYPHLPMMHETHRKRFFHSPWVCRDFILKTNNFGDELKMVADFSHFTCVAETDPSDPHLTAVIEGLAPRIWHIHGRVGYDHGPQVSDPRAPEWMPYTLGFEKWWDFVIQCQLNNTSANPSLVPTFTPEHGPPNYQPSLPYTRQPIADIWEVNTFIGNRAVDRFDKVVAGRQNSNSQAK